MKLEQEKTQKEADIKIKNGEVLSLQKELDAVSNTVKQLETQKTEAQKRLDELDDKVGVLTLWRPLLPYGYSYEASCARPG